MHWEPINIGNGQTNNKGVRTLKYLKGQWNLHYRIIFIAISIVATVAKEKEKGKQDNNPTDFVPDPYQMKH